MRPLRLELFGFPTYIAPWFWVTAVLIGYQGVLDQNLVVWVLAMLGSILVHELGHAWMWRVYGESPTITLHGFGGATSVRVAERPKPPQRILISLAGPFAGFVAGGVFVLLHTVGAWPEAEVFQYLYQSLLFINFGWGILNLLPIWPLDGGQVLEGGLDWLGLPGRTLALYTAMGLGAMAGLAAVYYSQWWLAMVCALLFGQALRAFQNQRAVERDTPLLEELDALLQRWEETPSERPSVQPRLLDAARSLIGGSSIAGWKAYASQVIIKVALHDRNAPLLAEGLRSVPEGMQLDERVARECATILRDGGEWSALAMVYETLFQDSHQSAHAIDGARAYLRAGDPEEAIALLMDAADHGWSNAFALEADADFAEVSRTELWTTLRDHIKSVS